MRVGRQVLPVLVVLTLAQLLARGSRAQDHQSAFEREIDTILDRWNDAVGEDRLGAALDLCRKRLAENPKDLDALLLSARLNNSKEEFQAAVRDAKRALDLAVKNGQDDETAKHAHALYYLASIGWFNQRAFAPASSERDAQVHELNERVRALQAELVAHVGTESVTEVLRQESQRISDLGSVNELGRPAKPLVTAGTDGNEIRLDAMKGKVVVVDFWSCRSGAYVAELSTMVSVYERCHVKGLEIVAVSLDEDRAELESLVKGERLSWLHHFDGTGLASPIFRAWGLKTAPRRYVIDRSGRVRYVDVWGPDFTKAVEDLLARPAR